jgi:Rieske Fe-S protein
MEHGQGRRAVLRAALGAGALLCASARHTIAHGAEPRSERPQAGDQLVFAAGERANQLIGADELVVGAPPVLAYPMDPASRVVRNGSRLNQLLVIRLTPAELDEETRMRAPDGVTAYSGVCTHAGCDITVWQTESRRFRCPCHESEFDPRQSGRVVGGPAPRRLPRLPVNIVGGVLVVGGSFIGRPGFQPA